MAAAELCDVQMWTCEPQGAHQKPVDSIAQCTHTADNTYGKVDTVTGWTSNCVRASKHEERGDWNASVV
jgi:hypothetical protein